MTILALAGSPHSPSQSEALMRAAIAGACEREGVTVESFRVADMAISPCRACGGCDETGLCVIRDDMDRLYPLLRGAERIIIASPIFFGSVTAWIKAVFDRCQACWAERYRVGADGPFGSPAAGLLACGERATTPEAGEAQGRRAPVQPRPLARKGLFISTCGTRIPTMFDGALAVIRPVFHVLDVELSCAVLIPGVDALGDVWSRPETLEQAREAGRALVQEPG